jgi:hypothetical protein
VSKAGRAPADDRRHSFSSHPSWDYLSNLCDAANFGFFTPLLSRPIFGKGILTPVKAKENHDGEEKID